MVKRESTARSPQVDFNCIKSQWIYYTAVRLHLSFYYKWMHVQCNIFSDSSLSIPGQIRYQKPTPAHKVTASWPAVTDGAFLPVFPGFSDHEVPKRAGMHANRNVRGEIASVWNITTLHCIVNYHRLLFQVSIKLSRDFDYIDGPKTSLTTLYRKVKATIWCMMWHM